MAEDTRAKEEERRDQERQSKPLAAWTAEDYQSLSPEEAWETYNYLVSIGEEKTAAYFYNNFENFQNQEISDEQRQQQEDANNPIRQVGTTGAATTLGALGTAAILSQFGDKKPVTDALTTALNTTNTGTTAANVGTAGTAGTAGTMTTAGTAGTAGTTGATTGATTAGTGSSIMQTAGEVMPWVGGAIQAYQTAEKLRERDEAAQHSGSASRGIRQEAQDWYDNLREKPLENIFQMNTLLPNLRMAQGALGGLFGSSKGKDQLRREAVRGALEDAGIFPDNDIWTFDDGTTFDFSRDGGARLVNVGTSELQPGGERGYYDVDWTDPNASNRVAAINPLVYALMPDDEKLRSDFGGYFYNALTAGNPADSGQRVREIYRKTFGGESEDDVRARASGAVWDAYNAGTINAQERNSALAAVDQQFGVINPNAGKGGTAEFGAAYIEPGKEGSYATVEGYEPNTENDFYAAEEKKREEEAAARSEQNDYLLKSTLPSSSNRFDYFGPSSGDSSSGSFTSGSSKPKSQSAYLLANGTEQQKDEVVKKLGQTLAQYLRDKF